MNREIKFRAWNKEDSNPKARMIYDAWITPRGAVIMPDEDEWMIPIMQFTGLKDKNGKEIYEGDIMKSFHFFDGRKKHYLFHEIKWDTEFLCWKAVSVNNPEGEGILTAHGNPQLFVYLKNSQDAEIIGNIFQNPELLK